MEQKKLFTEQTEPHKFSKAKFHGPAYEAPLDQVRLSGQLLKIYELMKDGKWRTLQEISRLTGAPEASASAQLRGLRRGDNGGHTVDKKRLGEPTVGLWTYRLIPNVLYSEDPPSEV